ncbi:MAG: bifunctional DNA primase/polymerase [Microcoleus sp. T1-bin1]|nr:bifunctional DNA primase/polymerase [Microcoleus sp. T1-bin1]
MTSVLNLSQESSLDLSKIPYPWPLVSVVGKRPCKKNWVNKECDRSEILAELENGKATGIGLKLGNGLLAIDFDGLSATKMLAKLAGSNSLDIFSETTAWTSGRAGRKQCLFSVAEADWPRLRNLPIPTGVIGDDGKEER